MYYLVHTLHFDSVKIFWQPHSFMPFRDCLDFSNLCIHIQFCNSINIRINVRKLQYDPFSLMHHICINHELELLSSTHNDDDETPKDWNRVAQKVIQYPKPPCLHHIISKRGKFFICPIDPSIYCFFVQITDALLFIGMYIGFFKVSIVSI
jgi:hypothetical protein